MQHQQMLGFAQSMSKRGMSGLSLLMRSKTDQRASQGTALNTLTSFSMSRAWVGDDDFSWRSTSAIVEWMMKLSPLAGDVNSKLAWWKQEFCGIMPDDSDGESGGWASHCAAETHSATNVRGPFRPCATQVTRLLTDAEGGAAQSEKTKQKKWTRISCTPQTQWHFHQTMTTQELITQLAMIPANVMFPHQAC